MNYQEILYQGSKILRLNEIKSYNLDTEWGVKYILMKKAVYLNTSIVIKMENDCLFIVAL